MMANRVGEPGALSRPDLDGEPVLQIRDLHVRFDEGRGAHALRGVDLDLHRGELLAVVGESGSGKSTLGLAVQQLLPTEARPELSGSIVVNGTEVVGASKTKARHIRRDWVRAVFQDPMSSLNPTMRIGKQLEEACAGDATALEWLTRVGIPDPEAKVRAFPHQLSGGQRQRVMIAMAMAANPAVVVADEPTTALDVTVQAQVLELIRSLRDERGVAFLFVTHDLAVASAIADRLLVLYHGRIVEIGPTSDVVGSAAHPYTVALLKARFGIDVDRSTPLPTIPGDPPGASESLHGCSFAPRCVLAEPACTEQEPPLVAVDQHPGLAACFRSRSVSSEVWDRGSGEWSMPEATGSAGNIVEVDNVSKSFSHSRFGNRSTQTLALDQVSLQVQEGESCALVGESGSGKTTLLRLVAGLVTPDVGTVRFVVEDQPQMVYQDAYASLTPWLTAGDLIGERLRRQHLPRSEYKARVEAALKMVGLHASIAEVRPPYLSGGQRQRVALARAIVVPPRLLLCDEPISAVDVSMGAAMLNLLQQLRLRLRMAVLFVTHDIAAARFIADRIVVMKAGQIVEAGDSDEVTHHPQHAYTQQLLAALPAPVG